MKIWYHDLYTFEDGTNNIFKTFYTGHSREAEIDDRDFDVEVEYEYEAAGGDGWNSPRLPECVNIYNVTISDTGEEIDFFEHEEYLEEVIWHHIHSYEEVY